MRSTLFIFLFVSIFNALHSNAQTVTLRARQMQLTQVFTEVKAQTGYYFLYAEDVVQHAKPVDIDVESMPILKFLQILFKTQPLQYSVSSKTINVTVSGTDRGQPNSQKSPDIVVGIVRTEGGEPVSGATVSSDKLNLATATDAKGYFSLKAVEEDNLTISYVGYRKQMIRTTNFSDTVMITIFKTVDLMEEVVVNKGYYNEKRKITTGNISTVGARDIAKQPINNPLLALQGRVAGMEIGQSSGLPGSGITVEIRGRNTINNGRDPLYIIDGVPYASERAVGLEISSGVLGYGNNAPGNLLSYINPADIQSIDILKDADATAIYGSRGANGVVLITTKKGSAGRMQLDVNLQTGIGKLTRKLSLLDTRQYLDMRYEAFKNDNAIPNPNVDFDLSLWDTTRSTDWQKVLLGGTAWHYDAQAALSGGNEQTKYRISGGYHKETTVFPGDFNDQKSNLQINLSSGSFDRKFLVEFSGLFSTDNNYLSTADYTEHAILLAPNAPALYLPDGSVNWAPTSSGKSSWQLVNPATIRLSTYNSRTNNLLTNLTARYKPATYLEFRMNLGFNQLGTNDVVKNPLAAVDPYDWAKTDRNSRFLENNTRSVIMEPQASYSRVLAKGMLNFLLGSTIQQTENTGQTLNAVGFSSDLLLGDVVSARTVTPLSNVSTVYRYNALFGRINYNFRDIYIINLTARRDGTSRFGPASRFHNFGAVGAAWIFSGLSFIETRFPKLSLGKLRASFGSTGNDQVGDYSYVDLFTSQSTGSPYQGVVGIRPTRLYTPYLEWEETHKLEAGLELGFFNNRMVGSASFFQNRSDNLLMEYRLPSYVGFTGINRNLDALVQNKGWEIELRTINISRKNFVWNTSVNFTLNRNKLLSVAPGVRENFKMMLGHPLNSVFVYPYAGVDFVTGYYQILNRHGSPTGTLDPVADATVLIDRTTKYSGGILNNFAIGNFQIDFLVQFARRPSAYFRDVNYIPGAFSSLNIGSNQPVSVLTRWQSAGDISNVQRFSQNNSTAGALNNMLNSERLYTDASFIKLRNASISWQFPATLNTKMHVRGCRIYLQGQNLLTLTKFPGLDPESTGPGYRLPALTVVKFGTQIQL